MGQFIQKFASRPEDPFVPAQVCGMAATFPALHEFLSLSFWDEGDSRETGTLLLCYGDGRFRAMLHDRDGQRSSWLSAETLEGLWHALEMGLRSGDLEWRPDQGKKGQSSRKGS